MIGTTRSAGAIARNEYWASGIDAFVAIAVDAKYMTAAERMPIAPSSFSEIWKTRCASSR